MSELARARCLFHAEREAAVRCPGCRRSFCRECVTEHDGRLLCRGCLATSALSLPSAATRRRWAWLATLVSALGLWLGLFLLGEGIRRLPDPRHDLAPEPSTSGEMSLRRNPSELVRIPNPDSRTTLRFGPA